MDLLLQLAVTDAVGGFSHRPGGLRLVPAPVPANLVELAFESRDALRQLLLRFRDLPHRLAGALLRQVLDRIPDPVLGRAQPLGLVDRGIHVAAEPLAALPVEIPARSAQLVRRGEAALQSLRASRVRGAHVLRGVPETAGNRRQVGARTLAGQALQPPGHVLGLGGNLVLRGAGASSRGLDPAPNPFVLLLLPPGEFGEALEHLVHFVVGGGPLPLLHRLVLVAELVHLQLEEIGEVLGLCRGSASAPSSAALTEGDLDLAEHGIGPLQVGQGLLFPGEGVIRVAGDEQFLGCRHLGETGVEVFHDLGEFGNVPDAAVAEPAGEGLHLFAQPALGEPDGGHRFGDRRRGHALAVPKDLERGDHDLLLAQREGSVEAPFAGAPSSTRHRIRLPVGPVERPDRDEEHVRGRFGAGPVPGRGVVGNEVAGHQVMLLEEERVAGLDLVAGGSGREHLAGLGASVDRNVDLEAPDGVVVFRQHLGEHFFHRIRLNVAPGTHELDVGRQVLQDLHEVVARRGAEVPIGAGEFHPVRAGFRERQARRQPFRARAGRRPAGFLDGFEGNLDRAGFQPQPAAGRRDRGGHREFHDRPREGCDVPAVLDLARREPGVRGIAIRQPDLRHVGDILDLDAIRGRDDSVSVHVVVRRIRDAEKQVTEDAVFRVGEHGNGLPEGTAFRPGMQFHPLGGEPFEARFDPAVRVAGDCRVAGFHVQAVGIRVGNVPPGGEEQAGAPEERGRRQERGHHRDPTDGGERARRPPQRRGLDVAALVQGFEPLDRLLHDQPGEVRGDPLLRRAVRGNLLPELHAADHRLAQGRIVLLDVEGDLLVADAEAQRPDDEAPHRRPEREPAGHLEAADDPGRVAERVHRRRRQTDHQHGRGAHHRAAENQPPGPPAAAYPTDDPAQVLVRRAWGGTQPEGLHGRRVGSIGNPAENLSQRETG